MSLKGTKTEENLKAAFAGESQANRRYLYFAAKADVEGYNDVATVFRSTAEGETGHAHGHLEYLEECGDPATGLPFGATGDNLKTAIAGETVSADSWLRKMIPMDSTSINAEMKKQRRETIEQYLTVGGNIRYRSRISKQVSSCRVNIF